MTVGRYNVTEGQHGPSEHEQATCILDSKSDKLTLENEFSYSTASFNILPLWVIIVNCNQLTWASTTCSTFSNTSAMLCWVWTPQRTGNETEGMPQVQERKAQSNKSTRMKGQQDRRVRTCTMVKLWSMIMPMLTIHSDMLISFIKSTVCITVVKSKERETVRHYSGLHFHSNFKGLHIVACMQISRYHYGWHGFRTEVQSAVMHCSLPLTDYFEFLHLHCLC